MSFVNKVFSVRVGVYVWGGAAAALAIILLFNIFCYGGTIINDDNGSVLASIIAAGTLTWSLFFKHNQEQSKIDDKLRDISEKLDRLVEN